VHIDRPFPTADGPPPRLAHAVPLGERTQHGALRFPGFVSKLWFAGDEYGTYRGVYDWDGVAAAHAYVRALWWALMVVSVRSSIEYVVVPGVRRDNFLGDASIGAANAPWCRPE
jgi:hypothetical protein